MSSFQPKTELTIPEVLENIGGGLYKRIDENRELIELLQAKVPMLLNECPWIVGWIQSNDDFFMSLEPHLMQLGAFNPKFYKHAGFPRLWPVQIEKLVAST